MARLEMAGRCSPAQEETCCEPGAKAECCGGEGSCRCAEGTDGAVDVRDAVRERYAAAARSVRADESGCGCGGSALPQEDREVFGSALYPDEDRDALPEAAVANAEFLKGTIEEIPLPDNSVDVIISNCVINLSGNKPGVFREAARVLRPGGRFAVSDVGADPNMDEATRQDMEQWTGCIGGALTREDFERDLVAAGFKAVEIQATHRVHEHAASAIVRAQLPAP
ncbi:MAG: methyltransferase domain-containing protein [Solirubrobacterales bacterium]